MMPPHDATASFKIADKEEMQLLTRKDDPHDFAVYDVAREEFIRRLRLYGLAVPDELVSPANDWS